MVYSGENLHTPILITRISLRNETKNALCYEIYPANLTLKYRYATIIAVYLSEEFKKLKEFA